MQPVTPGPGPGRRPRRRDRHGRGVRGPLAVRGPLTPTGVPATRSRAERFDDLVLDVVETLEHRWSSELDRVEFAVEDTPPPPEPAGGAAVALGTALPARPGTPPRVVLFRRPIELRTQGVEDLAGLVRAVVVEQVADLLGQNPDDLDPGDEG